MERDFKGVWIPKNIWLDNNLGWTEKLLLIEIDSLVTNGECFASNQYFGSFFNLSKDRISKIISELNKKGYIELKMIYKKDSKQIEKRIITTRGYRRKQLEGISESIDRGIGENTEDNNTSFNKPINNTKNNIKGAFEKKNALDIRSYSKFRYDSKLQFLKEVRFLLETNECRIADNIYEHFCIKFNCNHYKLNEEQLEKVREGIKFILEQIKKWPQLETLLERYFDLERQYYSIQDFTNLNTLSYLMSKTGIAEIERFDSDGSFGGVE